MTTLDTRLDILHTVYTQENGFLYTEIINMEFTKEYLVVEVLVTNTFVHTETYFASDLDEEALPIGTQVFLVEELANNPDLKDIIENGITSQEKDEA